MRRPSLVAFALAGVLLLAGLAVSASAGTPVLRLRPDVKPLDTSQVTIRHSDAGNKQLWLDFITSNVGPGPLEMQPLKRECDGDPGTNTDRAAVQHVYGDTNEDGVFTPDVDEVVRNIRAGCFVYHAVHGHWHFTNYARYRLVDLASGTTVASHSKVGFCMLDSVDLDATLPGHPDSREYLGCPDLALQGISVGWGDIYSLSTPGQFIGINGVRDGTYCLVSTADPGNRILESDDTDNQTRSRVRIRGDRAHLGTEPC